MNVVTLCAWLSVCTCNFVQNHLQENSDETNGNQEMLERKVSLQRVLTYSVVHVYSKLSVLAPSPYRISIQ